MKIWQDLAKALGVDVGDLFGLSGAGSSGEGNEMNRKSLWAAAEERLHMLYGEEPELYLDNTNISQNSTFFFRILSYLQQIHQR